MGSLLDFQTILFTARAVSYPGAALGCFPQAALLPPVSPHHRTASLFFQSCLRFPKGHSCSFPSAFQSEADEVKGFVLYVKSQRKGLYPFWTFVSPEFHISTLKQSTEGEQLAQLSLGGERGLSIS